MSHKFELGLKKVKKQIIVLSIIWIILVIVAISPLAYSIRYSMQEGVFAFEKLTSALVESITHPFKTLFIMLSGENIGIFWSILWKFTIAYIVLGIIGIIRATPKYEYQEIEHGSSDWCEGGEQYKVLSNNKGIILAEKHFLPLDKPGNTNVLVIGRIRFW